MRHGIDYRTSLYVHSCRIVHDTVYCIDYRDARALTCDVDSVRFKTKSQKGAV